eukprot:CAMPEP_0196664162 /NCGR_PEP_ID=MMETSP1086-20130531/56009_1 /TAXON_ID=77921 /ORGANISM="Cyanoptyche  gloeocystis , Strain SAG4.97" /LENGTH=111 /DNA_ID=CAMNT_0042000337 /DNA_START=185 /DNA_END=520 /DNA_ORIENTATION=-
MIDEKSNDRGMSLQRTKELTKYLRSLVHEEDNGALIDGAVLEPLSVTGNEEVAKESNLQDHLFWDHQQQLRGSVTLLADSLDERMKKKNVEAEYEGDLSCQNCRLGRRYAL